MLITRDRKSKVVNPIAVALLTGGDDRPYVFGLMTSLMARGAELDLIGSDALELPEFQSRPGLNFLNLRGSLREDESLAKKTFRVLLYYARLIRYAARARPEVMHILWNNKFEYFDRTVLMAYYRLLGKRVVLTAHNVNASVRDGNDSRLNRLTLKIQYQLADHIFVHTEKMRRELVEGFRISGAKVTVIPFGINNSVPDTALSAAEARRRLGVGENKRALLFYGRIAPAKGLEYLVKAFRQCLARREDYQLIIAGRPDRCETYWRAIRESIHEDVQQGRILLRAEFIPDAETEVYFKAADVLVLPYRDIFQSGVLFLGYNFGLPVLAADVGSLKEEVVEGKTGYVFRPEDPAALASAIEKYFASELYADLSSRRSQIRDFAAERHSWGTVGEITMGKYAGLLRKSLANQLSRSDAAKAPLDVKSPSSGN